MSFEAPAPTLSATGARSTEDSNTGSSGQALAKPSAPPRAWSSKVSSPTAMVSAVPGQVLLTEGHRGAATRRPRTCPASYRIQGVIAASTPATQVGSESPPKGWAIRWRLGKYGSRAPLRIRCCSASRLFDLLAIYPPRYVEHAAPGQLLYAMHEAGVLHLKSSKQVKSVESVVEWASVVFMLTSWP